MKEWVESICWTDFWVLIDHDLEAKNGGGTYSAMD
jgi:hypothetical protein